MSPGLSHAAMVGFPVADDCLVIGAIPLTRLAQRVGRTPFYAYDRQLVAERVRELRRNLPEAVRLHYAIKANPMPALACFLTALVDGFDVASAGELRVALDTGMDSTQISIAGPGKIDAELQQAIAGGVNINVESPGELERIERIAAAIGMRARVALRINPPFELKTSGMKMGGGPKQFGIDAEQVPHVLSQMDSEHTRLVGMHIYAGSQNLDASAIVDAQRKSLDLALSFKKHFPEPPSYINVGGGFGVPYFPGERALDLGVVGNGLRDLVKRLAEELHDTELVVELGRYIVAEAGIYVCRVVDRKVSRGQVYLITDGGLHHHLAASGNFGQVLRKNFPIVIGNRVVGTEREIASVVGPLCTPLDVLGDRIEVSRAEPGDLVVVFQSGAYGLTASPTAFLGHPPPAEVLV